MPGGVASSCLRSTRAMTERREDDVRMFVMNRLVFLLALTLLSARGDTAAQSVYLIKHGSRFPSPTSSCKHDPGCDLRSGLLLSVHLPVSRCSRLACRSLHIRRASLAVSGLAGERLVRSRRVIVRLSQVRFAFVSVLVFNALRCVNPPAVPAELRKSAEQRLESLKATSKCAPLPEEQRIALSARAAETPRGPAIHFRLTNVSGQPLRLYHFMLPWGNANAIDVSAVATNGETPAVFWPIDDPGPDEPFVLSSGESLEGESVLAYRIPDVAKARAKSDVLIAWCYRFMVIGESKSGRLDGTVVLPKRAEGHAAVRIDTTSILL